MDFKMPKTRGKECLDGLIGDDREASVDSVTFDNQNNYINHKRLRQINDTTSEYELKLLNRDTSDLPELTSQFTRNNSVVHSIGNVPLIFSCKQRRLSKLNFKKSCM